MASTLYISVTVDWEGRVFDDGIVTSYAKNLDSLEQVRKGIVSLGFDIPWTHFITPNYWLNGTSDPTNVLKGTSAIDWSKDEIGLHVHCWYSLVSNAGVSTLVGQPTFGSTDSFGDDVSGHGVPLGIYSVSDIVKIVGYAKTLLEQKLPYPHTVQGFRCGGWMSDDDVLQALMQLGFAYDCSAVPPAVFSQGFGLSSLGDMKDTAGDKNAITAFLLNLWGYTPCSSGVCKNGYTLKWNAGEAILPTTQPYKIFASGPSIIQMPNNGGLSDYASEPYMTTAFGDAVNLASSSDEPVFLNIGCHQEGPIEYKQSLLDFFTNNRDQLLDLQQQGKVQFVTVLDASKSADLHMVD